MPDVCVAAGVRLTVLISVLWIGNVPAWGQVHSGNPFDTGRALGYSSHGLSELSDSMVSVPDSSERVPAGPATVSSDVLRHPLSSKARRRLEKAMHFAGLGNHAAAIQILRDALIKEPSTAPYAENMLGLEYVENRQYAEAKSSFEEAVRLMPHESVNHSNLGYSLAVEGDWNSAEQEARKALQLDSANSKAKSLLDLLLSRKRRTADHGR
jgi:Flp pilus assembly protein TadD